MAPVVGPASFGPRQAQPLDHLMGDARSAVEGLFGKTATDELPPFARAAIENTARVRGLAARLFAGAEGEELLEALCDAVIRRPMFITQMGLPPDQVLAMGQFREGMSASIFLLLTWIAEGRSEQPPQREGGTTNASVRKRRKPAIDDRNAAGGVRAAGRARKRTRRS